MCKPLKVNNWFSDRRGADIFLYRLNSDFKTMPALLVTYCMRPEHKKDYSYENIQLVIDDMEEKRAAGKLKYGNRKYVNPPIKWPTLVIK